MVFLFMIIQLILYFIELFILDYKVVVFCPINILIKKSDYFFNYFFNRLIDFLFNEINYYFFYFIFFSI